MFDCEGFSSSVQRLISACELQRLLHLKRAILSKKKKGHLYLDLLYPSTPEGADTDTEYWASKKSNQILLAHIQQRNVSEC